MLPVRLQCQSSRFCNLKKDIEDSISEGSSRYNQLFSNTLYIDNEKKEKHFQYTIKPINYNGESLCLLIMDDVSESFLKSQQLQEALNKKNELIGIAAHDIRSPLSSIKNTLNLLLSSESEKKEEDYKISLEHVLETVNYSLRLVDDILDSSALDAGELNLSQKKQNYKDFVIDVLKEKKFIAKQKSINIVHQIQTDAEIYFDRIKIHQVFDNLIQNAIEYSPVNSEIKIRVYQEESNIITEVHDEGIGISEENRNIIFNKYLMEKKNYNKNPEERSGLGLAIAKLIIRKHRGNIDVESELGKGSVFIFSLPSI